MAPFCFWNRTIKLSQGVPNRLCKRAGFVFADGVRGDEQFPFPRPTGPTIKLRAVKGLRRREERGVKFGPFRLRRELRLVAKLFSDQSPSTQLMFAPGMRWP
jgi:hypothetical protein